MRVIAGDFKGRKLETPFDDRVRPTSDKVKEALFSILMNETGDAVVCDLFAGTGSLGIEALSRGAKRCYFADAASSSIKLVKTNVKKCEAENMSVIIHGDYLNALGRIKEKVDIFLLDPPYGNGLEIEAIKEIENRDLLAKDGVIVVEHHKDDKMPETIGKFTMYKEKKYGRIVLSLYI